MKYIFKTKQGYYKFCRKIPNTKIQFIFSLKTKNAKISRKIVNKFLIKSNHYFLHLQNLGKKEIMSKIQEIQNILYDYRKEALQEYSKLEEDRHKHFKYKDMDGSHPEALNYWSKELHNYVCSRKTEKQTQELTKQILKRSILPLKHYFSTLITAEDKRTFAQLLIKMEVKILKEDYKRAKEYFDLDYQLEHDNTKQLEESIINKINNNISITNPKELAMKLSMQDKAKYLTKTKYEIFEEYEENKIVSGTYNKDKIKSPIITLFQSSKEEFLIDYTKEDFDLFFETLLYTPNSITLKKQIFNDYEENFVAIAEAFKNDDLEEYTEKYELAFQSIGNLKEKLGNVSTFLTYCIHNDYLDRNTLEKNERYNPKRFNNVAKATLSREPFSTTELKLMFELMQDKDFLNNNEICNFYIPLIALFSGMRLEEIAKLKVSDIKKEDNIYFFDIYGQVKTKNSTRLVPIHKILINKFRFIEYVKSRKDNEMLFNLKKITLGKKIKFSHYYSRYFSDFRNNFVSEDRIERDLISFHSFRHTAGTRLSEADIEDSHISVILGHIPDKNDTPRYAKQTLKKRHRLINKMDIKDIEKSLNKLSLYFKSYKF
jgi:integrase